MPSSSGACSIRQRRYTSIFKGVFADTITRRRNCHGTGKIRASPKCVVSYRGKPAAGKRDARQVCRKPGIAASGIKRSITCACQAGGSRQVKVDVRALVR